MIGSIFVCLNFNYKKKLILYLEDIRELDLPLQILLEHAQRQALTQTLTITTI